MLKALMLRKKINDKTAELNQLRAADANFEARETEIKGAIDEAGTDEERSAVEETIDQFEQDKQEHIEKMQALEREIGELEEELRELEAAQETAPGHGTGKRHREKAPGNSIGKKRSRRPGNKR